MNQKRSIALRAEMIDPINAPVEAGTDGSASDVVQAAMQAPVERDDD